MCCYGFHDVIMLLEKQHKLSFNTTRLISGLLGEHTSEPPWQDAVSTLMQSLIGLKISIVSVIDLYKGVMYLKKKKKALHLDSKH